MAADVDGEGDRGARGILRVVRRASTDKGSPEDGDQDFAWGDLVCGVWIFEGASRVDYLGGLGDDVELEAEDGGAVGVRRCRKTDAVICWRVVIAMLSIELLALLDVARRRKEGGSARATRETSASLGDRHSFQLQRFLTQIACGKAFGHQAKNCGHPSDVGDRVV